MCIPGLQQAFFYNLAELAPAYRFKSGDLNGNRQYNYSAFGL